MKPRAGDLLVSTARHLCVGDILTTYRSDGRPRGLLTVTSVDPRANTITYVLPTWWQRIKFYLRHPSWWLVALDIPFLPNWGSD